MITHIFDSSTSRARRGLTTTVVLFVQVSQTIRHGCVITLRAQLSSRCTVCIGSERFVPFHRSEMSHKVSRWFVAYAVGSQVRTSESVGLSVVDLIPCIFQPPHGQARQDASFRYNGRHELVVEAIFRKVSTLSLDIVRDGCGATADALIFGICLRVGIGGRTLTYRANAL
jgi:hypothetical protein